MIKKRLAGFVTVHGGWAVQSFGYQRYLPLGRPEILIQNLDRWGADEIFVHCTDRGQQGPDFALIERISKLGLSTPLIYGGGIRSAADGVRVIQSGADRICVDALLHDDLPNAIGIGEPLGAQALIASLPVSRRGNELLWYDYRDRTSAPFSGTLLEALGSGAISEALVIDWEHEGLPLGFDEALVSLFPVPQAHLIAFGGISGAGQIRALLERPNVAAVTIGNFLSYREHAVQELKLQLGGLPLRPAQFDRTVWN